MFPLRMNHKLIRLEMETDKVSIYPISTWVIRATGYWNLGQ